MEKYFNLLLDLLEIPQNDNYQKILGVIEENKEKNIHFYHQYSFIFQWYQDLLNNKISIEEFLQLWDINSKLKFDIKKQDFISYLKSNSVLDKNTLYVFDNLAKWIIEEQVNVFYC